MSQTAKLCCRWHLVRKHSNVNPGVGSAHWDFLSLKACLYVWLVAYGSDAENHIHQGDKTCFWKLWVENKLEMSGSTEWPLT